MSAPLRVRMASASAGTGKTHHLVETVVDAMIAGECRPEALVAVTYTNAAANELRGRIRRRLFERSRSDGPELAMRVRDGWIGTVHGLCERIVGQYALDGGLPMRPRLLSEAAGAHLIDRSIGKVLATRRTRVDERALRFGITEWRKSVLRRLIDRARANRIDAEGIRASGRASVAGLHDLLRDGDPIDQDAFADALKQALAVVREMPPDDYGTTRRRLDEAFRLIRGVEHGRIGWPEIDRFQRELAGTKKLDAWSRPLSEVWAQHPRSPAFRADLLGLAEEMFELAAQSLEVYQHQKRRAMVFDYDDLLADALRMLERDDVAEGLGSDLDLVVVDEFQDTSPIQLALFVRLAAIARGSVWVGDPKQAIYGFNGADAELVDAAGRAVAGDRPHTVLDVTWRARPPLAELCNVLFAPVFAGQGLSRDRVVVRTARAEIDAREPFFEAWSIVGGRGRDDDREANGIAAGIAQLVAGGADRPVSPSEIAVLLRYNSTCQKLAQALAQRGIPARVRLGRLFDTPEARLVYCALALLADPQAGARAFELVWLSGDIAADPDSGLAAEIGTGAPQREPFQTNPRVAALRELAQMALSPAQAFDRAVDAARLREICLGWPDAPRRLANLEALRKEVEEYEQNAVVEGRAGTLVGLVRHFVDLIAARDDDRRTQQAMPTDLAAVTITTYHGAKGLEWPVVILGGLGNAPRPSVFDVAVEPAERFDATRPLDGRTLRWWPYPYGQRRAGLSGDPSVFEARAVGSSVGRALVEREAREHLRLLYVGFTRARDRLVLAAQVRDDQARTAWLDALRDEGNQPLLQIPWTATSESVAALIGGPGGLQITARLRRLAAERAPLVRTGPVSTFLLAPGSRSDRAPDVILPSSVELGESVAVEVVIPDTLSHKVALTGHVEHMDQLGDAIHEFLAGDGDRGEEQRIGLARRLLQSHDVAGAVDPADVPRVADALAAWVQGRFGTRGVWYREWPVRWLVPTDPQRLLIGEIDLAVDVGAGLIVIDHKSFPGDAAARDARARGYAGQLAAYRAALEAATGRKVLGTFIHFPVRGEVQEVRIPAAAFADWLGVVERPVVEVPKVVPSPQRPVRTVVPRRAPSKKVREEDEDSKAQLSLFAEPEDD